MLPQVLDQQIVHSFKYWNDGICVGMRHGEKLYARVRSYAVKERLQAYALGCDLADQGHDVCITRSQWRYTIWINLRSDLQLTGLSDESSSDESPFDESPSEVNHLRAVEPSFRARV